MQMAGIGKKYQISIRVFVEVPGQDEAAATGMSIREKLAELADVIRFDEVKSYWKIPEWFEIFIVARPRSDGAISAYAEIVKSLGTGWESSRGTADEENQWAVWNPGPKSRFLIPQVRWANVELFPDADGCP